MHVCVKQSLQCCVALWMRKQQQSDSKPQKCKNLAVLLIIKYKFSILKKTFLPY